MSTTPCHFCNAPTSGANRDHAGRVWCGCPRPILREAITRAIVVRGVSQREVAEEAGVDQGSLSNYLRGRRGLRAETIERVMEVLGLAVVMVETDGRVEWSLGGEG